MSANESGAGPKPNPSPDPRPVPPKEDEVQKRITDEIFKRDLYECYLLIDYISGRSDRGLDDLGSLVLDDGKGTVDPTARRARATAVLLAFCNIGYPPKPNPAKAADAALLLQMKDHLNGSANPAKGLTIAYTSMFTARPAGPRKWRNWIALHILSVVPCPPEVPSPYRPTSRAELAREAYPSLIRSAWLMSLLVGTIMPLLLAIFFAMTAVTYWDVSFGKSILEQIEQLEKQTTGTLPSGKIVTDADCRPPKLTIPADIPLENICQSIDSVRKKLSVNYESMKTFHEGLVSPLNWHSLFNVLRPTWYGLKAYNLTKQAGEAADVGDTRYPGWPINNSFGTFLALYSSSVLPMMFGLLGTIASMMRLIQVKVQEYLLAPRDLLLTLIGLLLGPLAGFAIGQYYNPANSPGWAAAGSSGGVVLTASGLGFLAGYGADAFFKMLDALLIRIFTLK